ncbi:MAG: carbohydrate ABC transporter permease [Rhodoluna sp.]|jgi:multiple sugar transport system permease protein
MKLAKKSLLTAAAWFVGFLFLVPYLRMLTTSLTPDQELYSIPAEYFPSRLEFSNFITVWDSAPIADYIVNTLIIAGAATILVLLVAVPAAYYLARFRFRGRGLVLLLVLATQMFAPTSMVIGIYREFVSLGLVNTYLALILVNAAFNLAFSVWILSGFFSGIPAEVEEAAMLDGCSRWQVMRRVTLPLSLPGLLTAIIFTFIAAWNEFVVALTLTSTPDVRPLTVGLTGFVGLYEVQWHYVFAVSLIAIIPVVILFISIEKWLVSGLTAGSIK